MFAFFILLTSIYAQEKFMLSIYMESQCSDTHALIQKSLREALFSEDINEIIDIRYIPYGNCWQKPNLNGTWNFICQHGEVECYGNLMEICFLNKMEGFYTQLEFLECIHSKKKKTKEEYDIDGEECMSKHVDLFEKVKICMNSKEGNQLMHEAGVETDQLDPKKYVVPWITVNGVFDFDTYYDIKQNIVEWACLNYGGNKDLKSCKKVTTIFKNQ